MLSKCWQPYARTWTMKNIFDAQILLNLSMTLNVFVTNSGNCLYYDENCLLFWKWKHIQRYRWTWTLKSEAIFHVHLLIYLKCNIEWIYGLYIFVMQFFFFINRCHWISPFNTIRPGIYCIFNAIWNIPIRNLLIKKSSFHSIKQVKLAINIYSNVSYPDSTKTNINNTWFNDRFSSPFPAIFQHCSKYINL